jgi:hypothetical protein
MEGAALLGADPFLMLSEKDLGGTDTTANVQQATAERDEPASKQQGVDSGLSSSPSSKRVEQSTISTPPGKPPRPIKSSSRSQPGLSASSKSPPPKSPLTRSPPINKRLGETDLPTTVGPSNPAHQSPSAQDALATPPLRPVSVECSSAPTDAIKEMLVVKLETFYHSVNPGTK